jgi:serine/threonine protein phosphatase PrpC
MFTCSACGAGNRDQAKFCQACGSPLTLPMEAEFEFEEPADELATVILPTEIQAGNLPPGTLLQERYEIVGLVARQTDHATYRAYDQRRCPACGTEVLLEGQPFCPGCGVELTQPATCLLHEWLVEPESARGETFERGGRTFSVAVEEAPAEKLSSGRGVRLTVGIHSAKGPDLAVNQDSLLALTLTPMFEGRPAPALGLFAVADGIGEHQAGGIASRAAVRALAQGLISGVLMAELGGDGCLDETLIQIVGEAVEEANAQVYAIAQGRGSDTGSTLTAALVRDDLAVVASVGDSRTYHWHDGALRQVTTDHSVVERLVVAGEITPEEAAGHAQKGVLYRSLGDRPTVEVDVLSLRLAPGDRLLLCCDGVWESLGDKGLEEAMLLEVDPQRICEQVVRQASKAGAVDNVSVVVVDLAELC